MPLSMKRVMHLYPGAVLISEGAIPSPRVTRCASSLLRWSVAQSPGDYPCIRLYTDGATRRPLCPGDPTCGRTCDAVPALDCPGHYCLRPDVRAVETVCGCANSLIHLPLQAGLVSPRASFFYFHCHQTVIIKTYNCHQFVLFCSS